ncbi:MAG TPA: hypothetical protein VMX17_01690 [Candidatus Glassbacteria bacterium]|nr:hypothetical protein [Candidatus Glassbacteria bacterium]
MNRTAENGSIGLFDMDSKFVKILLVLTSVFLIFVGPTYVSYVLAQVLNLNYFAVIIVGFILFLSGLFLMYFLIKKKIIA